MGLKAQSIREEIFVLYSYIVKASVAYAGSEGLVFLYQREKLVLRFEEEDWIIQAASESEKYLCMASCPGLALYNLLDGSTGTGILTQGQDQWRSHRESDAEEKGHRLLC